MTPQICRVLLLPESSPISLAVTNLLPSLECWVNRSYHTDFLKGWDFFHLKEFILILRFHPCCCISHEFTPFCSLALQYREITSFVPGYFSRFCCQEHSFHEHFWPFSFLRANHQVVELLNHNDKFVIISFLLNLIKYPFSSIYLVLSSPM